MNTKLEIYKVKQYCAGCHIRIMPFEPEAGFYRGAKWHDKCLRRKLINRKKEVISNAL